MTIATDVLDYSLLTAHFYLLIRLSLSKRKVFRTQFFQLFIITGFFCSLSVIGFIIALRFTYPEDLGWLFKFGFILNSFSVTASTIGKLYMSAIRYAVMRSDSLSENV
ncbi:hypothetical protein PFISCL1PPCAC_28532, partial [Pristionchus fissidentatus]